MEENQVIEVEYDKDLVEEYKAHKGEIIEGIGAEDVQDPEYGLQTEFNTDSIDELLGEGAELDDEYKNN